MNFDVVKRICHCIEILVGEKKQGVLLASSTTETGAFLVHLNDNVSSVLSEVKAYPEIQELLRAYEKYMISENEDYVHWNFVKWCLILITVLHDSLSSKTSDAATATPTLSISQRKAVEKCLQFIIALGFLPNLLPGLGIPLRSRTEYGGIVAHVGKNLCPRTKYKYLITSLTVLLRCTSHVELQSIIITRHTGDLLAALFQLCYAPIKKLKSHEFCSSSGEDGSRCHPADVRLKNKSFPLFTNLIDRLEDAREHSQWSENQLIGEMWEDRSNFLPHLEQLLQKICPQVLIWELFLLQGMCHKSVKEKQCKIPLWLRKLCNQMLTEQLLKPHGLKLFICIMLDKVTDSDLKDGAVDKTKVEAVARLISSNPFQSMSLENYIKNISDQIIDLLHSRESQVDYIYACVASSVVLQFADIDQHISKKYIFDRIFKDLLMCLDRAEISRCQEGDFIIKEDVLTTCIENIYQIFIQSGVLSQHGTFDFLLPFYHLLFIMFSETQNGVSFLSPKLKRLLTSLLKNCSVDDSLTLLRLALFEDVTFHPVQFATDLKCVLGDSGGIVLIKNSNLRSEELLESINKKCAAVISILDEVSNKKLKVSYFLGLLKRLTNLFVNGANADAAYEATDFKNNLTLLQQLQDMSETIGEDLVEDTVEAVHFIKLTLEKAAVAQNSDQCEPLLFGSETVAMSLVILSTIVEYKSQLSSAHWKAMNECLPSLEKLMVNSDDAVLKNMCEKLVFAIATHGATTNIQKSKEPSVQKHNSTNISHFKEALSAKESTAFEITNPVSVEMKHKVTKEAISGENSYEILNCAYGDHVVDMTPSKDPANGGCSDHLRTDASAVFQQDCPSSHNYRNETLSDLPLRNMSSTADYLDSPYNSALRDLSDPVLPVRGHGLITLTQLIRGNNEETLAHKENLLKIFLENLSDEDSYIYLASIKGLSALADVSTELILPEVLKRFCSANNDNCEVQLKLGEVLMKVCKNLGKMTIKYRNEFIHAYLCGTRHNKPEIRASSLSNLGEVCKCLKFSLEPFLQEILLCVLSLLKTDTDMEVRRSAALVLTLLLQGTGKDAFMVLENEMKELYRTLKNVYCQGKDDVLKLHAQLALEEINIIVKEVFCDRPAFTKEIRVIDPF